MRTFETATTMDWITDRAVRAMIRMASALPYAARVRVFGAVVAGAFAPLFGYRSRAEAQVALIFPDLSLSERKRIAKASCNNFGRTLIENYSGTDFARRIETANVRGPGLDALHEARTSGQPVLFVTGHFGNHEAPRQALTQRGYKIGGLYRPVANPYFNAHYEQTMLPMSGAVFPQGRKGTAGFIRMLRDGGMGTLLFDVRATGFPRIPFLGHPAHTATSVADIALRLDALILPYFGIRHDNGLDFDVVIEAPVALTSVDDIMSEVTARLETHIRAHPEQYFWIHRRWG